MRIASITLLSLALAACSEDAPRRDSAVEASARDVVTDASNATEDSGALVDTGAAVDTGVAMDSATVADTGVAFDSGVALDTGVTIDSGVTVDTGVIVDSGVRVDTGVIVDSGVRIDSGVRVDSGVSSARCLSGATGTHVARIRWTGSAPTSRASVVYEANSLPDTSRWRAGAYSRGSIGSYTPTFTDTFLGEGGLELGSTNFIDIELSTAGLGAISNVTIALYGRSFNTGSPGSYSWMTFDGAGSVPSGTVANSAPYQWYRGNATTAFRPGNAGVLLRVSPGGPSSTLIVNRVELCFDAR